MMYILHSLLVKRGSSPLQINQRLKTAASVNSRVFHLWSQKLTHGQTSSSLYAQITLNPQNRLIGL